MDKEFDLELCMTRDGGRCKTRDGRDARIICTDLKTNGEYKILALVTFEDGTEFPMSYTYSRHDLVNLTIKKQAWINVYKEDLDNDYSVRKYHDSKEKAMANRNDALSYIKSILIHEWEE